MKAEFAGRSGAGDGRELRVQRSQSRAFGIAGDRPTLDIGQLVAEPAMALRQRLRMGAHRADARQLVVTAQQIVSNDQAGLADDEQRRAQKEI